MSSPEEIKIVYYVGSFMRELFGLSKAKYLSAICFFQPEDHFDQLSLMIGI
jgi:hypothetical protein